MAYFLFLDESGLDRRESPYEVLAGISVEDRQIWSLIDAINRAEVRILGVRYGREVREIKGKNFLKRKVFKQASRLPPMGDVVRRTLASECLDAGSTANERQITALAQAKVAFVGEVFRLAEQYGCRAFASIVTRDAPRPLAEVLRKDYAFLFERFYYFLEDRGHDVQGVVVFDELEKSQAKILVGQMEEYFLRTTRGRTRAQQIIPQPFFVHSDLTSLIQVADLLAYLISWAFRIPEALNAEARAELAPFATQVANLRYHCQRKILGRADFVVWSFAVIDDLRGWEDQ